MPLSLGGMEGIKKTAHRRSAILFSFLRCPVEQELPNAPKNTRGNYHESHDDDQGTSKSCDCSEHNAENTAKTDTERAPQQAIQKLINHIHDFTSEQLKGY